MPVLFRRCVGWGQRLLLLLGALLVVQAATSRAAFAQADTGRVKGGARGDTISITDYRFRTTRPTLGDTLRPPTSIATPGLPGAICLLSGAPPTLLASDAACRPCSAKFVDGPSGLWRDAPPCSPCARPGLSSVWSGGTNCATPRELVAIIQTVTRGPVGGFSWADGSTSYARAGAYPITTCTWNWGDNSAKTVVAAQAGTCTQQAHIYAAGGRYNIALTVENGGKDLPSTANATIDFGTTTGITPCQLVGAPGTLAASDAACRPCSLSLMEGPTGLWADAPSCAPCTKAGMSGYWASGPTCQAVRGALYITHVAVPNGGLLGWPALAGGSLTTFAELSASPDAQDIKTLFVKIGNNTQAIPINARYASPGFTINYPTAPGTYLLTLTAWNGIDTDGYRAFAINVQSAALEPCRLQGAPAGMLASDLACKPCSARFLEGSASLYQFDSACTPCPKSGYTTYWSGGTMCSAKGQLYASLTASAITVAVGTPVMISYNGYAGANASPITKYELQVPTGQSGAGTYVMPGNLTHVFTAPGNYVYFLTVSNSAGDTPGYASLLVTVQSGGNTETYCTLTGAPPTLKSTDAGCQPCSARFQEGSSTLWSGAPTCSACTRPTLEAYAADGPTCATKRNLYAVVTATPARVTEGASYVVEACGSSKDAAAFPIQRYVIAVNGTPVLDGPLCGPVTVSTPITGLGRTDAITATVSNGIDHDGTASTAVLVEAQGIASEPCLLKDAPGTLLKTDASCQPCTYNTAYWAGSTQCNTIPNTFLFRLDPARSNLPNPRGIYYQVACDVTDWNTDPVTITCDGEAEAVELPPGVSPMHDFHLSLGVTSGGTVIGASYQRWVAPCTYEGGCGEYGFPSVGTVSYTGNVPTNPYEGYWRVYWRPQGDQRERVKIQMQFTAARRDGQKGDLVMPYTTFYSPSQGAGLVTWTWELVKVWR